MSKHLQRDLEHLKKELLIVGTMVEEAISRAIVALIDRREDVAQSVITGDRIIDEKEVDIEEDCLKALALHQPVAGDLRYIISVLKVNNDLERMGDHAVNIAERATYLARKASVNIAVDFRPFADRVRTMVRESLDALVNLDTELARRVCQEDEAADSFNKEMFFKLRDAMSRDQSCIESALDMLSASKHLERIADLATNIAEDVIFLVEGDVVRHMLQGRKGRRSKTEQAVKAN